jgi:cobalt-zinc-cadmium efflux system outer membrane protein
MNVPVHDCARVKLSAFTPVLAAIVMMAWPPAVSAQSISLRQALTLARDADPGLPAASARIVAAEAALRQAGVRPNPVIGGDLENFAGTGAHGLVEHVETTLYYQQMIERGDKRAARQGVAGADLNVVRLRRSVRALDLFSQVETAWTEAVAAEASVRIAEDQLTAAQALRTEVERRVQAARDPLFARARAETAVAQAEIAVSQAQIAAQNARAALAAFWGGPANFQLDPTALEALPGASAAMPERTTDLALLEAERDAATSRIRLEQSRSVPDITLKGGVRTFGVADELAFIVGGSMPLGVYDTNRGNIERAEAERLAAERDIAAARVARDREIVRLRARLEADATEIRRIEMEVVPKAQETITLVREGFNRGGFSTIDVIDAQRALIDAQARRLQVLRNLQLDQAALDRLTDRFADLIPDMETLP